MINYQIIDNKLSVHSMISASISPLHKIFSVDYTRFTFQGKGYHYPNNMDFLSWGTLHKKDKNKYTILHKDGSSHYLIELNENSIKVQHKIDQFTICIFTDNSNKKDYFNTFTRTIKQSERNYC